MIVQPGVAIARDADVCVIGSGPAGLAVALACEDAGLSVTVLESGTERPCAATHASPDTISANGHHAPLAVTAAEAFGGTSHWWGGRCMPFDAIDFMTRPYLSEARWPIGFSDVAPWYEHAARFLGCGPNRFVSSRDDLGGVRFDELERWTPECNIGTFHRKRIEASQRVCLVLGCRVTGLQLNAGGTQVESLSIARSAPSVRAKHYVLACGGLGTTRLLLLAQRQWPRHFGGTDGALGRYYMGHISGKIANITLAKPAEAGRHDFFYDDGCFARRRFTIPAHTQLSKQLYNIAFWADNPLFHDASHRNGVLSAVWLVLAAPLIGRRLVSEGIRLKHLGPKPWQISQHLRNILLDPLGTAYDLVRVVRERLLRRPRKPGFLLTSRNGHYALHFHAEHAPHADSRVRLSESTDADGVPQLAIDFRYHLDDAESVVHAHETLDESLRSSGRGYLEYHVPPEARAESLLAQAEDGYHQIGLTRMSTSPADGVVDTNCRVHGLSNLHVASSSVFPSSGQAAPTFFTVALGIRLASHLAQQLKTNCADTRLDSILAKLHA